LFLKRLERYGNLSTLLGTHARTNAMTARKRVEPMVLLRMRNRFKGPASALAIGRQTSCAELKLDIRQKRVRAPQFSGHLRYKTYVLALLASFSLTALPEAVH
jgi:hypothetical protein